MQLIVAILFKYGDFRKLNVTRHATKQVKQTAQINKLVCRLFVNLWSPGTNGREFNTDTNSITLESGACQRAWWVLMSYADAFHLQKAVSLHNDTDINGPKWYVSVRHSSFWDAFVSLITTSCHYHHLLWAALLSGFFGAYFLQVAQRKLWLIFICAAQNPACWF